MSKLFFLYEQDVMTMNNTYSEGNMYTYMERVTNVWLGDVLKMIHLLHVYIEEFLK